MLQINDQISENLKVKELGENQVAIYKLCDADLVDRARVDEGTGKPRNNQPRLNMKGEIMIVDPFTKKRVKLRNIVGYKTVERNGQLIDEPEVKRVQFDHNSTISIGPDDQGTYLFMERHPHNRDNPYRDKSRPKAKFYRVNAKKKAIQEMEYNYILADALTHVSQADKVELALIWKNLDPTSRKDINPEGTFEQFKRDTFELAKKKPDVVMKASSNKMMKAKLQIMDAEYYNIIQFLESDEENPGINRRWVFVDKDEDICDVPIDVNRFDGLLNYMFSVGIEEKKMKPEERDEIRKIGHTAYQQMAEKLRKIFQPKATVPA